MGKDFTALHSLRLAYHDYKKEGEIDFVIVCPRGVFVLEVKGGEVTCSNGLWRFEGRDGQYYTKHESPFDQARSGKESLLKSIRERLPYGESDAFIDGHGVVFAHCEMSDLASVEWARETLLDAGQYTGDDAFKRYLEGLIRYWVDAHPRKRSPLDQEQTARLVRLMRPKFERTQSLSVVAREAEAETVAFTEEQYDRLDDAEDNEQLIFSGGAGTGKTFLAVELATRLSDQGKRVLFLCNSPVLSTWIRRRFPGSSVDCHSIRRVGAHVGKDERYDAVIVDEGQDLMSFTALDQIESVLEGGLADGRWTFFVDVNRQKNVAGRFEEEAWEFLNSFRPARLKLRRNCRNTRNIIEHIVLMTGDDPGEPAVGKGPKVVMKWSKSVEHEASILEDQVSAWISEGIPPGEITILTATTRSESVMSRMPGHFRSSVVDLEEQSVRSFPMNRVTHSTVAEFKGLENRFVAVTGLGAFDFENPDFLNVLYVAMSRARVGLSLVLPQGQKGAVLGAQTRNARRFIS